MLIYKVFRPAEWSQMQADGQTSGAPVDLTDGYIHFSTATQLPETLRKHFGDAPQIVLLACDADAFAGDLRWEVSRGGDLFPHLYRALRMGDVLWDRIIKATPNGHDTGPLA